MRIIDIDNELILGHDLKVFNPGLFELNGKTFLCFRFEPTRTFETNLGIVELDSSFMPITKTIKFLMLPRQGGAVRTLDDPRCFDYDGAIHILHAQGALTATGGWSNGQVITRMNDDMSFAKSILLDYGKNINYSNRGHEYACEKNWTPFKHRNQLRIIYKIDPLEVFEVYQDQFDPTHKCKFIKTQEAALGWDFGWPSGGTPLIRRGNEYWGIFHSHLPNKEHIRDYFMGFYAISVDEPHRVTRISKKPILSAEMDEKHDLRGINAGWIPNAIFPCGILERAGKAYISYGWQDCRCKILETSYEELLEGSREIVYKNNGK